MQTVARVDVETAGSLDWAAMIPDEGNLDLLAIGETVVDFISAEKSDTPSNATPFRRYLGGSPANIAVYVSKLGGRSAVIAKTGIGAFGKFLKSELQRHGVVAYYLPMDHRTHTTVIIVSSTAPPDFEEFRSGDYLLEPGEVSEGAIERASVLHSSASAHEVVALKPGVGGHVERVIDRQALYERIAETTRQRARRPRKVSPA